MQHICSMNIAVPRDRQDVECSVNDYGTVFEGTSASMCRACHSFFASPCLRTYGKFPTATGTIFVKFDAGKLNGTLSIPFKFWLKLDNSNGQSEDVHFCGILQRA
jgi:hypothetical protein